MTTYESKLQLIKDEEAYIIQPSLIKAMVTIGIKEKNLNASFAFRDAIFLQKLHEALYEKSIMYQNKRWVVLSLQDIANIILGNVQTADTLTKRLEGYGVLVQAETEELYFDYYTRKRYYTINYKRLQEIIDDRDNRSEVKDKIWKMKTQKKRKLKWKPNLT